jgi:glutaconate CoA-transferase subunit B
MRGYDYTLEELLAVEMSRHIRHDDICGFIGTGTGGKAYIRAVGIPAVAARLAQLRQAPDFIMCLGSVVDMDLDGDSIPETNFEPDVLSWPGRSQLPSYDVLNFFMRGRVSIGFISAPQVDQYGCTNIVQIGSEGQVRARFPGCLAQSEIMSTAKRTFGIFHHDKRTFVEHVDFISSAGRKNREGLSGGGLSLVLTQYAVMDFREDGMMKVRSIHPGSTKKQIIENTGFDILIPDDAHETEAPSKEDIELIRTMIDPKRKFLNAVITGEPAKLLD